MLGLALVYAGCSARQEPVPQSGPPFVTMRTKFDYSEHESYAKAGDNGIRGQALSGSKELVSQRVQGTAFCCCQRHLTFVKCSGT
jgi:hypothetical protein